jgi:hypothetical protein
MNATNGKKVYNNSGTLFSNYTKREDRQPDYKGEVLIEGKRYWISGWLRKDKNGRPWLSLAFKAVQPLPKSAYPIGPKTEPQSSPELTAPATSRSPRS